MKLVDFKEIKKGDVFYERGGLDWYEFKALEDSYLKGVIDISGKTYNQYVVKVLNEFGEETRLLITEGLPMYANAYYMNVKNGND